MSLAMIVVSAILVFCSGIGLGYEIGKREGYKIGWLIGGIDCQKEIDAKERIRHL